MAKLALRMMLPIMFLRVSLACTVWKVRGHGFTANLHNLFSIFPIFDGRNGTFYIDNRYNSYSCTLSRGSENGWFDFFDSTDTGVLPWTAEEDISLNNTCRIISFTDVRQILTKINRDSVQLKAISVKKLWKFVPAVQNRIDDVLRKISQLPSPTIGFHVRGGDKIIEDNLLGRNTMRPGDLVKRYREAFGMKGGTCVLVGDDPALIAQTRELVQKEIGCEIFFVRPPVPDKELETGHSQVKFNNLPLQQRCQGTIDLIVDIEVLAHTDYFIGSYTSGLPQLIELLRFAIYGKDRGTFADASVHHLDFFSTARSYLQS